MALIGLNAFKENIILLAEQTITMTETNKKAPGKFHITPERHGIYRERMYNTLTITVARIGRERTKARKRQREKGREEEELCLLEI